MFKCRGSLCMSVLLHALTCPAVQVLHGNEQDACMAGSSPSLSHRHLEMQQGAAGLGSPAGAQCVAVAARLCCGLQAQQYASHILGPVRSGAGFAPAGSPWHALPATQLHKPVRLYTAGPAPFVCLCMFVAPSCSSLVGWGELGPEGSAALPDEGC